MITVLLLTLFPLISSYIHSSVVSNVYPSGQVTVLQSYSSSCDKEREAKFVFPLDEGCAGWMI